ncbi:MAG TPA: 1-acyl-sn-glycerol-3-phosphate acyltransferase [Clostridiales bacterium]|nr:MAG: hypothetical protein A2Y18_05490 [Clostridiales bacterium GWD2_32_19]HCC07440.1 1-acyl-sn-glycerol-3-phosphate acyltransferase [Clostridiales bacterium]
MRTILFYLFSIWELVTNTIFNMKKATKWKNEGNKEELDKFFVNKIYHKAIRRILNVSGVVLEVEGIENVPVDGPLVLISNHQGNFDVIALVASINRRVGFIVKKELRDMPFLGSWVENMGSLFIDRGNIRQSAQIVVEAIDYINAGNAIMIFPEGTRSKSDIVGEFKSGSFKIATKAGANIVPVSISGSYKVMEANNGKVKSGKIKIKYHKVIQTKDMNREDVNEIHNTVKEIIIKGLKEQLQRTITKNKEDSII